MKVRKVTRLSAERVEARRRSWSSSAVGRNIVQAGLCLSRPSRGVSARERSAAARLPPRLLARRRGGWHRLRRGERGHRPGDP